MFRLECDFCLLVCCLLFMANEWKADQSDTCRNVKRVLPPSASVKLMELSSCGQLECKKKFN